MIVYGRRTSSNAQKVLWALDELGRKFELKEVGGSFGQTREPWYVALNPASLIPTIDDDGFILWESHAILRYLARSDEGAALYPRDIRQAAGADQWMDWLAQSVNPHMRPVFVGLVRTPPEQRDAAGIDAANQALSRLWAILDRQLEGREFILGAAFSIADIACAIQAYRWLKLVPDHAQLPNVERWMQAMHARPAFRTNVGMPLS